MIQVQRVIQTSNLISRTQFISTMIIFFPQVQCPAFFSSGVMPYYLSQLLKAMVKLSITLAKSVLSLWKAACVGITTLFPPLLLLSLRCPEMNKA